MDAPVPAERPAPLWPYLLANAVAAACLCLSSFQEMQSADSLIFYLSSLYELRPFFWEQDRVGMLIPCLASWCHSPFYNLLLQSWTMAFAGLTFPVLLARVLTKQPLAPLAATIANVAILAFAPDLVMEDNFLVCNYPSALLLGLLAFMSIDGRKRGEGWGRLSLRALACAFFLVLALWQYLGAILFLGPLVAFRAWARTGPGAPTRPDPAWLVPFRPFTDLRCLIIAPAILVALSVSLWSMAVHREIYVANYPDSASGLPMDEWGDNWPKFLEVCSAMPGVKEFARIGGAVALAGMLLGLFLDRRMLGRMVWAGLPALLAALTEFAMLGTRKWPSQNHYHPRYLVAILGALLLAVSMAALVPLLNRLPRKAQWLVIALAGLSLSGAVVWRYGAPSPRHVREILDQNFGALTPVVLDTGCEAIGGDYWTIWGAMFHANMVLHERGEDRVVFGVAHRCDAMRQRWLRHPEGFRVLVPEPQLEVAEGTGIGHGLTEFERIADLGRVQPGRFFHTQEPWVPVGLYFTAPQPEE